MERVRGDRLAMPTAIITIAIGLVGTILTIVAWPDLRIDDAIPTLVGSFAGPLYAVLGALILRRAGNPVGRMLQGAGFATATLTLVSAYAVVGILTYPGSLPAPELVGAAAAPLFAALAITLGYLLLFFPTGTLPSPRWRPVLAIGLVAAALTVVGMAIVPPLEALPGPGGVSLIYANPWAVSSVVVSTLLVVAVWVVSLVTGAGFLSLVLRYRTGSDEQRQQIKWVAGAAATALALNVAALASLVACGCDRSNLALTFLLAEAFVILVGFPAALVIAILKYRLYDIDVIINRAVVYGVLASAFTIVYIGIVVGIGSLVGARDNSALTIAAAVAIALLFQPLRARARTLANRLVYGERATPYHVLSEFADRMAVTFSLEDVLHRMTSILAAGTGASRVDVWLRFGEELRPAAVWPADAAEPSSLRLLRGGELPAFDGAARAAPVRHADDLLGVLTIEKPPNEPLTPQEDKLLADLASQAGLVLRNVRLTADLQASLDDLRASRRRLVGAQDEERRKIERNLHDGAQQQLVALTVQLGLLERVAEDPERVRALVPQIRDALGDALDDLRDLARGIYPPLLADAGLVAAVSAQARKAAVPITVHGDGLGRYPREVEAAMYFCTLEALQNIAKYADASGASVRFAHDDGTLSFVVEDDGKGFDPATAHGSGIQGMVDRLDAIGGALTVESRPHEGTLVRGAVPLDAEPAMDARDSGP